MRQFINLVNVGANHRFAPTLTCSVAVRAMYHSRFPPLAGGRRAGGRVPGAERGIVDVVLAVFIGLIRIILAVRRLAQFELGQ